MASFRKAKESQEGIIVLTQKTASRYTTYKNPVGTTKKVLSVTKTEVLDCISEGEIEGLVEGEYNFIGRPGQIGYDGYTYNEFPTLGGVKWLRSVYWNAVPVAGPGTDGADQFNFQQVNVKFTPGLPNGSIENSIDTELTVTKVIGERLRGGGNAFSKYYRILNKECRGLLLNVKVNQFFSQSTKAKTYGDILETTISYNISYRPIFGSPSNLASSTVSLSNVAFKFLKEETIRGKISYGYIRSSRLNFPDFDQLTLKENFLGWEIKVTRDTEDSIVRTTQNQTYIDSLSEIYGNVYSYPNSAIVSSIFSAEYFQQVPSRAFDTKLLKIKVPNNYDPIKRTYGDSNLGTTAGGVDFWNGQFKEEKEWSSNPAWCFYDLVTNKRYGLGEYISEESVDKWGLYEIAKYCDTLVGDGFGGVEPRFACNLLLTQREEAVKVLNDLASIFRGITYYAGGTIFTASDGPKAVLTHFTNANVENGDFTYSSSSKAVRHTVAVVRYNDRNNFYAPTVEYVEDFEGIRRYGIRELELTAFGCTSRGQALRLGRWGLLTEIFETETINFAAGLEASILRPGDVVGVSDSNRKVKRHAGRINQINIYDTGSRIVLDSLVTGFNANDKYKFSVLTPGYNYDQTLVDVTNSVEAQSIKRPQLQTVLFSGYQALQENGRTVLNISPEFLNNSNEFDSTNYSIGNNLIWSIEGSGVDISSSISNKEYDYYRVVNKVEKEGKYEIFGISYYADKYDVIESGLNFLDVSATEKPSKPNNINLSLRELTVNSKIIDYVVGASEENIDSISDYAVYSKSSPIADADVTSDTYLVGYVPKESPRGSIVPTSNATYYFRVYSANKYGVKSVGYTENSISVGGVNPIQDVIIGSLDLATGEAFIPNEPGVSFTGINTTPEAVIGWETYFAEGLNLPSDFKYNISFRTPTFTNTPAPYPNIIWSGIGISADAFEPTFEFGLDLNTGFAREFEAVVYAVDAAGNASAGGNVLMGGDPTFANPNGYDILYVNNPAITGIILTTGVKHPDSPFVTDEYFTSDGDIRVFLSGGYDGYTDRAGAVAYWSRDPFTNTEILNQTIETTIIQETGQTLIFPAKVSSYSSLYLGLSLYDSMDAARSQTQPNWLKTGLFVSNIHKITKRGGFDSYGLLYRAWVKFDFNPDSLSSPSYIGTNIKEITMHPTSELSSADRGTAPFYAKIFFETPMADDNYAIIGNVDRTTAEDDFIFPVRVFSKTNQSIYIVENGPGKGKKNAGLKGTYTFGVLHS